MSSSMPVMLKTLLILNFMFMGTSFAQETKVGTSKTSINRGSEYRKSDLNSGWEINASIPINANNQGSYDPALHIRYFLIDDFSLGLFGRQSSHSNYDSNALGVSMRAYFLTLGNFQFHFTQSFAWAHNSYDDEFADNENFEKKDDWFQMIARIGVQVELNKGLSVGLDLNDQNWASNNNSAYEVRANLNYHLDPNDYTTTGSTSYKVTEDEVSESRLNSSQTMFGSKSMGHLVSSNATSLNKGQKVFGTLYTGYGITDEWSLVTSPFAYLLFDMWSVVSRLGFDVNNKSRVGLETSYYKSINNSDEKRTVFEDGTKGGFSGFQMEAASAKLTYAYLVAPFYRASLTGSYFHYYDEERPFSLRMDPLNDDKFAANLTSLHELRLANNFFINAEFGFWGLNYEYPYYHTGLTISFQRKNIYMGLGISSTFSPKFPEEKVSRFAGYDSRISVHPELQAQLFF